MFFEHKAFWLPKDVRREGEYEDAFQADPVRGIAAIADGVSSSIFSGSWARLLVEGVVANAPNIYDGNSLWPWLAELRNQWAAPIDVESLAWHQKSKVREGGASTLLAAAVTHIAMNDSEAEGVYRLFAYAVGDCCLYHVRENEVLRAFPIEESRLFQTSPKTIGSVDTNRDHLIEFDTLEDDCDAGDLLVLCSDAVAAWALEELEAGRNPQWENCWGLSQEQFRGFVAQLREQNRIRFDDTTVLMLKLSQPSRTETTSVAASYAKKLEQRAEASLTEKLKGGAAKLKKKLGWTDPSGES
jgi:serine/threonine protein phosphatase PrpC